MSIHRVVAVREKDGWSCRVDVTDQTGCFFRCRSDDLSCIVGHLSKDHGLIGYVFNPNTGKIYFKQEGVGMKEPKKKVYCVRTSGGEGGTPEYRVTRVINSTDPPPGLVLLKHEVDALISTGVEVVIDKAR